jgi:hypothetical protein
MKRTLIAAAVALAAAAGLASEASAFPWAHMPEITRRAGPPGGTMVMWPRVVPETTDPTVHQVATELQQRLIAIAARVTPSDRVVLIRPEPERTCRDNGCRSATLGVFLAHRDGGCAAVALITPPGPSSTRLVAWGGDVLLAADALGFRSPPESVVTVRDFAPCSQLPSLLDDQAVEEALRGVLTAAPSLPSSRLATEVAAPVEP